LSGTAVTYVALDQQLSAPGGWSRRRHAKRFLAGPP